MAQAGTGDGADEPPRRLAWWRAAALGAVLFAAVPAHAQSLEERLAGCAQCHGRDGISTRAETPSLAGQPADFLLVQLFVFREGLRPQTPMTAYARDLSNADMQALAAHYAGLPPPEPRPERRPALYARGAEIAARHRCAACHLPSYAGGGQVPLLAGQREDYLAMTLRDYKSGARPGYEPAMAEVLTAISTEQIDALAHYLTHFDG